MSAIVTKFICSTIMSIMGFITVKKICCSDEKIYKLKNIVLMLCIIVIPQLTHNEEYSYLYTISVYITMCIIYKYIFSISFSKAVISCGVLMAFLFLFDLIISSIFMIYLSIEQLRGLWYINIISNIIIFICILLVFNIKSILSKVISFTEKAETSRALSYILFFLLTTIAMSAIVNIISINYKFNYAFIISIVILIIFFVLVIILINERNNYDKLFTEYDSLFNYVKVFEDWIEKEQLNRHEYKNQLAVLRCMTKEKKVKDKIDSIINETINIDGEMVGQLRNLPNGGFKGLLYYKIVIARKQKINIEVDVSSEVSKKLKRLNKEELETLSKLIGIYCDNAIEAAKETRKKIVLIEIYEYNNIINIVISNTFNKKRDITRRNEKGVSTKGEGRGNGLYFARKLISKNKWIEEKQDIVDNFYIQKLSIKKIRTKKKK